MNNRMKVSNVYVTISNAAGQKETLTYSGDHCEGLFFNDRAANEILAPFYNTYKSTYTAEGIAESCGSNAMELLKGNQSAPVTPEMVKDLWQLGNEKNIRAPFMGKTVDCTPVAPRMTISGFERERPQVTAIEVEYVLPHGGIAVDSLNPAATEGLFFNDRAVLEILAPFYNSHQSIFNTMSFANNCGTDAMDLMKGNDFMQVTPGLIEELWHHTNENGLLPPYMGKTVDCTPEIPVMQSRVSIKAA